MEASTDDDFGGGRNYQHQHPKIDDDDKPNECQGRDAYKPNTEDLSQKPPRHGEGGTHPHHIQTIWTCWLHLKLGLATAGNVFLVGNNHVVATRERQTTLKMDLRMQFRRQSAVIILS